MVGTQWHTYVRRMIWFRTGKLKNWNCTKQRLKIESRKQDEFQKQQQAMVQMMAQQQQAALSVSQRSTPTCPGFITFYPF